MLLCFSVVVTGVLGHDPGSEIVAKYGTTPTIDGIISLGEWVDANITTFNETTVYVKQDGVNLYVAFNVSDSVFSAGDECHIYLDVEHDGSSSLQSDDRALVVKRGGGLVELKGPGIWQWEPTPFGWTAKVNSTSTVWQAEYNITYSKINVTAGSTKTLGVVFESFDYRGLGDPDYPGIRYMWPYSTDPDFDKKPDQWGDVTPDGYLWTVPEFPNFWILVMVLTAALPILFYINARAKRGARA